MLLDGCLLKVEISMQGYLKQNLLRMPRRANMEGAVDAISVRRLGSHAYRYDVC
jgi:hypothetical protein